MSKMDPTGLTEMIKAFYKPACAKFDLEDTPSQSQADDAIFSDDDEDDKPVTSENSAVSALSVGSAASAAAWSRARGSNSASSVSSGRKDSVAFDKDDLTFDQIRQQQFRKAAQAKADKRVKLKTQQLARIPDKIFPDWSPKRGDSAPSSPSIPVAGRQGPGVRGSASSQFDDEDFSDIDSDDGSGSENMRAGDFRRSAMAGNTFNRSPTPDELWTNNPAFPEQ
jgi:hypothetical protein